MKPSVGMTDSFLVIWIVLHYISFLCYSRNHFSVVKKHCFVCLFLNIFVVLTIAFKKSRISCNVRKFPDACTYS